MIPVKRNYFTGQAEVRNIPIEAQPS